MAQRNQFWTYAYESKFSHQGTTGFSPCFHLPGSIGYIFLSTAIWPKVVRSSLFFPATLAANEAHCQVVEALSAEQKDEETELMRLKVKARGSLGHSC